MMQNKESHGKSVHFNLMPALVTAHDAVNSLIAYSLGHVGHKGQSVFFWSPIRALGKAHIDTANTWITLSNHSVKPHVCCLTGNYSQWAPTPNSSSARSLSASISSRSKWKAKFSELSPQRQMCSSETDSVMSFACDGSVCQAVPVGRSGDIFVIGW